MLLFDMDGICWHVVIINLDLSIVSVDMYMDAVSVNCE